MRIRDLNESDLPAIGELLRQLGYDIEPPVLEAAAADIVGNADHLAVVAIDGGAILGFLHAFTRPALEKPGEAVVQSLVVDEAHRGAGTGRALMQAAENWAAAQGCSRLALYTRTDREDAQAFYARLGYETAATSYLMVKVLQ